MTQTPRAKFAYPKGRMLLVRDSTVDICNNNNPGAVLLSTLLFWYDNPHKFDTYQDGTFTMCRTQASIEEQACHQIDVKTIHDTAVPLLQLFGYLTVQEKMNGNLYTLHMEHIYAAYAAWKCGEKAVKDFLKSSLQLESAPIKLSPNELELTLINKRWLYLQLERVLIATREDSNCKRGRKPRPQVAAVAQSADTETSRDPRENGKREESVSATATTPASLFPPSPENEDNQATEPGGTRVPPESKKRGRQKPPTPKKPPTQTPSKPEPSGPILSSECQSVRDAWNSLHKVPVPFGSKSVESAEFMAKACDAWCPVLQVNQAEFLRKLVTWGWEHDKEKKYFANRGAGIMLTDLPRIFEGWQAAQERPKLKPPTNEHKATNVENTLEDDPYSISALLARQKRLAAQEA